MNYVHHYIFRQEGWRIEHEDPNDQDSPILFKGVVFNEMKGVFVSEVHFITCMVFIYWRVSRHSIYVGMTLT